MVAYIRKMAVEQNHWLDEESFRSGVALCQTIPGATAMQTAAYVGLRARGTLGAMASYVGFGLPAFLLMVVFSALYLKMHRLPAAVSLFHGLQALVVSIVANATVSFGRNSLRQWKDGVIAVTAAVLFALKANPIPVILLAALLGALFYGDMPTAHPPMGSKRNPYPLRAFSLLLMFSAIGFLLLFLLDRPLFTLALLMSRIDLFAFGGGFASVPLMFHEVVEVRSWMDGPTFLNGIALGQVTPGPIVITATFVGYLLQGFIGGLVATIAVFLPSFLLVVALVPCFDRLQASPLFNRALRGILCSFVGLLLSVTIRFGDSVSWDLPRILLAGAAFIALLRKVNILWVVLGGSIAALVLLR